MPPWPGPPAPGHIHVWMCAGLTDASSDMLLCSLGAAEQKRAAAFRFEADRRRFVGARFLLRSVLARYLDTTPESLRFDAGAWGKPFLAPSSAPRLGFNLSRSHEVALVAVSGSGEVGVDVEYRRSMRSYALLVERHYSPPEQDYVARAEDPEGAFYEIWTRKEAYLKAIGRGLSHPLAEFSVAPSRETACSAVHDWSPSNNGPSWLVRSLSLPIPCYTAALAYQDPDSRVELLPVTTERLAGARP